MRHYLVSCWLAARESQSTDSSGGRDHWASGEHSMTLPALFTCPPPHPWGRGWGRLNVQITAHPSVMIVQERINPGNWIVPYWPTGQAYNTTQVLLLYILRWLPNKEVRMISKITRSLFMKSYVKCTLIVTGLYSWTDNLWIKWMNEWMN